MGGVGWNPPRDRWRSRRSRKQKPETEARKAAYGCRSRHSDTRTRGKLLDGSCLCIEGHGQRVNYRGDA